MKLKVPPSKSITQRALIISHLTDGGAKLVNPLKSEDTMLLKNALKHLGKTSPLFLGNNGTGIRFITALATLEKGKTVITGDKRMQKRPIKDLVNALKDLGADISCKNGYPPVKVNGNGTLHGGEVKMKANLSSQYLSAILLIAPYAKNDVTIKIEGKLTSRPYIDLTIGVMKEFGIKVINKNYKSFYVKTGQKYKVRKYEIEGDASGAAYFYAIAHLTRKKITVTNIPKDSLQGDMKFKKLLTGKPIRKDFNDMPDQVPLAAAIAALTNGKSELSNIENLRIKECDRIKIMQKELKKIGIKTRSGKNWLEVYGNPSKIKGATIDPHKDHRIAMAFAVMKAVVPGIKILDPSCVKKSYPNFWKDYKKMTGCEQI